MICGCLTFANARRATTPLLPIAERFLPIAARARSLSASAIDNLRQAVISKRMSVTFQDIASAAKRIAGAVFPSPCPPSIPLSEAAGMNIFCKLEYLQRTGSFKERGARNALALLPAERRQRGVIAASAGNHALGLAYHGQLLKIPVTVVMPRFAPLTKVTNCRRFGAKIILHGSDLAEAHARADEIAAAEKLTYINGYDDPAIIAGQGTLGLEIAEQVPDLDAVIVPIGGGGLIAGVALALKTLNPKVKIIGVEPERAGAFTAALRAGRPVRIETRPTLADGLSVAQAGGNAFRIARDLVDTTVQVKERDLALAILRLLELEKSVVEGAGAAPLAACLSGQLAGLKGKNVVLPLSGGNIDTPILGRVLERGLVSDGRLFRFTANISDHPGGLARFSGLIAETGASIIEIAHDRAFSSEDITTVNVHCVVETRDAAHIEELRVRLAKEGFPVATATLPP
jgi:threonine dehydratase